MSQLLVRDVDEKVVAALRSRARSRGVSMQKELRDILTQVAAWEEASATPVVYPSVRPAKVTGAPASRELVGSRS